MSDVEPLVGAVGLILRASRARREPACLVPAAATLHFESFTAAAISCCVLCPEWR